MSHDETSEPTEHERTLPIQEAIAKVACRLLGDRGDAEIERAIRNATVSLVPAYIPPDRPIDIDVSIADEAGLEVERNTHLTRIEASMPEVLGASLGSAAASALRGFYVGDNGDAAERAVEAAALQLRGSS